MKSTKTSFLFFYLIIACFILFNGHVNAQKPLDSIKYYSDIVRNPKNSNDLARAYNFFIKKREKHADKGETSNEIYTIQFLADIQKRLGYIGESERLNIQCLELLDLLKVDEWSTDSKVKTINDLGKIYRQKKDYKEALKIYRNGLKLAKKKRDINIILNNIGYVFLKENELQKALEYFDSAYKKALKNKDTLNVARSLDNLGFTKSKMKIDGAEKDLIEALKIREKENYSLGIAHSCENLARHFHSIKDSVKALFYSDRVIYLAKETNNLEQIESALRLKIDLGDDLVIRDYINIRDSLDDKKEADRISFNHYVYQYDKKEKELQRSKLENERQKNIKLIYLFSGLLVLLGSIFLYFILKSRHKKDKLQQVFNTESRISKKVHDEVANDVFQIMTTLQSTKQNEALIDDIEQIYVKTRDISKEHSVIDLEGNFEDILNDLILSYNTVETNTIAKGISKVNWDAVSELKRVTIYKVLQELFINMKKHSQASIVVLTFETNRKKMLINYSDNGIGCDLKKGTGLLNVENRIASINGTITFDSEINKGFKVKLRV
nr:tetratricopeptide repeat protein [uncultured Psychroserpens sp.]